MAPRLELYPFRFRDPCTGKWIRARYVAELHEISARYAEWEIIGASGDSRASIRTHAISRRIGVTLATRGR